MTGQRYGLEEFVNGLQAMTARSHDPRVIVYRVGPLARAQALRV
jgi:hypothetical protein